MAQWGESVHCYSETPTLKISQCLLSEVCRAVNPQVLGQGNCLNKCRYIFYCPLLTRSAKNEIRKSKKKRSPLAFPNWQMISTLSQFQFRLVSFYKSTSLLRSDLVDTFYHQAVPTQGNWWSSWYPHTKWIPQVRQNLAFNFNQNL